MNEIFKKIYIGIFQLLLIFILLFFFGCSSIISTDSKTTESLVLQDQKITESSTSKSDSNQDGNVPLPPDEANGLFVFDNIIYCADYKAGLKILDSRDKSNIKQIANLPVKGDAVDVFVKDDCAFIAAGNSGLIVADISNHKDLKIIESFEELRRENPNGYSKRVLCRDNILFLSDSSGGLVIIDINDINKPDLLSIIKSPMDGYILDCLLIDDLAFLADDRSGILTVDISNLRNPVLLSQTPVEGMAQCLAAENIDYIDNGNGNNTENKNDFIYAANYNGGMQIIDINDPKNLKTIGKYSDLSHAVSIAVSGNTVFVSDYDGLAIIDISNRKNPVLNENLDTGKTNDVYVYEGYVYTAGEKGVSVFELE